MQGIMIEQTVKNIIREVPGFPTPEILFYDITPVLLDGAAFGGVVDWITERCREASPDVVVAIESRGFIVGAPVSLQLGLGFVPVRKAGKLPWETVEAEYSLEYGSSVVQMHRDAIRPGAKAVIVDDLLATGGTARATAQLVEELGGQVSAFCFMIELESLNGRKLLEGYPVSSLVTY